MTEAAHQMTSNPLPPKNRFPGSVGPGTGVDVAIMDESGTLQPVNGKGEVVIRGSNVTHGYEDNPEANASSFTHGWFRTGDVGVLHPKGYMEITDRSKDVIKSGLGKYLGLADRCNAYSAHCPTGSQLLMRYRRASMGRDVRPHASRPVSEEGMERLYVVLQ